MNKAQELMRGDPNITSAMMRRLIKHYGGEWGTYGPANKKARIKLGKLLKCDQSWVFKIAQGDRQPGLYPWMVMLRKIKEIENNL
jgi:hypothetical protein